MSLSPGFNYLLRVTYTDIGRIPIGSYELDIGFSNGSVSLTQVELGVTVIGLNSSKVDSYPLNLEQPFVIETFPQEVEDVGILANDPVLLSSEPDSFFSLPNEGSYF